MRPNWFIGFPVAAGPWLEALTRPPPGGRLFAAEDVHVTWAFLGPVTEGEARTAWREAASRAAEASRWTMVPSGLRPFGDPRRPSAWSVEPEPALPEVEALIGNHRDALCAAAGIPAARWDRRAPRPHATLARPLRQADAEAHRALRAWAEAQRVPRTAIAVARVALYTWSRERRERLFERVDERDLGGPAP